MLQAQACWDGLMESDSVTDFPYEAEWPGHGHQKEAQSLWFAPH